MMGGRMYKGLSKLVVVAREIIELKSKQEEQKS